MKEQGRRNVVVKCVLNKEVRSIVSSRGCIPSPEEINPNAQTAKLDALFCCVEISKVNRVSASDPRCLQKKVT